MRDVVVVDSVRTGLAKSFRGSFNLTRSDDMLAHLIDAHVYIFRAYYSLPPMEAPDGTPTQAAYGFLGLPAPARGPDQFDLLAGGTGEDEEAGT